MENIKDGTAEFRVTDDRLFSILDLIFPVGRIIISNDSTAPYSDIGFGTWQEVAKGAFIEGADDSHKAGSTIEAGLPNITGSAEDQCLTNSVEDSDQRYAEGALSWKLAEHINGNSDGVGKPKSFGLHFDASKSSPIYGKSNTVQPKAYISHYWLRVK